MQMFSNQKANHISLPVLLPIRKKTHPIKIALERGNEEKIPNKAQARSQVCSFLFFQLNHPRSMTAIATIPD